MVIFDKVGRGEVRRVSEMICEVSENGMAWVLLQIMVMLRQGLAVHIDKKGEVSVSGHA